jgi:hypothetical protein
VKNKQSLDDMRIKNALYHLKTTFMKSISLIILSFFAFQNASAHSVNAVTDTLPYYEIPNCPDSYTPKNVVARMIDGLGFRYYWATEGLTAKDLAFRPTPEARTSEETIDHILGLSTIILNAFQKKENTRSGEETSTLTFEIKRQRTLENLKTASDLLKNDKVALEDSKIVFKNDGKTTEYPLWNLINGPIEDAVWHVGQVVTFRRSSGNPFNAKASVLVGKVRQ